jgi:Na+-transporting methylmalonyl-CoA/oxaloacetate decarboxylase gamma subunit
LNPITQGLIISGLGLFITFFALGIFILVIILLQRFFPVRHEPENAVSQPEESPIEVQVDTCGDEQEVAAAIAVAIQVFRSRQTELGSSLGSGRGSWWYAGRAAARQINHRKN